MTLQYRKNVCLFILNFENELFIGERNGEKGVYQLPQGGVEEDGTVEENVLREAFEELGADQKLFTIIKKFESTFKYDFLEPPKYALNKYKGQAQTFWLLRFSGNDQDIKLDKYHPEFMSYMWIEPEELLQKAEKKRVEGYKKPLEELLRCL